MNRLLKGEEYEKSTVLMVSGTNEDDAIYRLENRYGYVDISADRFAELLFEAFQKEGWKEHSDGKLMNALCNEEIRAGNSGPKESD